MRFAGTVKWFNDAKGLGFVTPDDGGEDVLVRSAEIDMAGATALADGLRVTFEERWGTRGRERLKVRPA